MFSSVVGMMIRSLAGRMMTYCTVKQATTNFMAVLVAMCFSGISIKLSTMPIQLS